MRMARQPGDVGDAVVGAGARAEGGSADVDGVRAMVHRFDADVSITGGGQQLQVVVRQ